MALGLFDDIAPATREWQIAVAATLSLRHIWRVTAGYQSETMRQMPCAENDDRSVSALDFLLPGAPLVSASAARRAAAALRDFVAVPRFAIECRLGEGDEQVDIQECLSRAEGDYPALAARASTWHARDPEDRGFRQLADFCRELAQPDGHLHQGIEELFLEHDLPSGQRKPAAPSVFLSLPQDREAALEVALAALKLLRASPVPAGMADTLVRCFEGCEGDAHVGAIGVMLSRPLDVVRVNVKRLRPHQVAPFLEQIGWPGDRARAAALFAANVRKVDRVTLALDVGVAPLARIGFECFLDDQPGRDLRWRTVFDELVAEGLWSSEKADAFLRAPRDFLPGTAPGPWPDAMIRKSILRDQTEFSSFARRAVHYKIVEAPGVREAKAYLGAGHLWRSLERDPEVRRWQPQFSRGVSSAAVHLAGPAVSASRAIGNGVRFLRDAQLQSGLWRDFVTRGIADEWVSAFVACQLCATGEEGARQAALACWEQLLACERDEGGWGYSWDCPPDADSTAWVIRLAVALGCPQHPAIARARAHLMRYVGDTGGVTTVADAAGWAKLLGKDSDFSFAGWQQPHDCVTAAAAPFLSERSLDYLRTRQRAGVWDGYWWHHPAYATALAAEALAGGDAVRVAAARQAAARWIADDAGATAFDLAFALRAVIAGADPLSGSATAAIERLLPQQREDGRWPSGARLRVPMPGSIDPGAASDWIRYDDRSNFTTAAVIGALAAARAAGMAKEPA
ncbi:MAG: hypothetical protein J7483_07120 [Novosphingobium sp.]|nr:hypothetical protein [Novosphingobium sp.]